MRGMNAARHPLVTDPTTPPCSEVWTRDSDDEYEESQVDTGTGMVGDSEGGRASDKLLDLNNLIWMREAEARRDEGGGYAANLGHVSTERKPRTMTTRLASKAVPWHARDR